jgi:hypothetical protein
MKSGMLVIGLGILGVIVGGGLYVADYHRTIGLAGIGLGIVLLIAGAAMSMRKEKAMPTPDPKQTITT